MAASVKSYKLKTNLKCASKPILKCARLSGQTTATNGQKIIVSLPPNSSVDLSSFEMNFDLSTFEMNFELHNIEAIMQSLMFLSAPPIMMAANIDG